MGSDYERGFDDGWLGARDTTREQIDRVIRERNAIIQQRDALAEALRAIAIMDIRPHPTGDFEAEALAEAQRISRAALAVLEEEE